ncbi:hypothetical protein GCM10009642_30350 [Nocardiopsis metallicus]
MALQERFHRRVRLDVRGGVEHLVEGAGAGRVRALCRKSSRSLRSSGFEAVRFRTRYRFGQGSREASSGSLMGAQDEHGAGPTVTVHGPTSGSRWEIRSPVLLEDGCDQWLRCYCSREQ